MRSFLAFSLVVMAGCGDDLVGPDDAVDSVGDHAGMANDNSGSAPAALHPELCGARTFDDAMIDDKEMVLRALPTHMGTAVLSIPKSGGALWGFVADARGLIVGDPHGAKVIGGEYSNLTASRVDGRIVASVVRGEKTEMYVINDDLSEIHAIDTVGAGVLANSAVVRSHDRLISLTGSENGIVSTAFTTDLSSLGSSLYSTDIATSISTTPYGTDAMLAWSTDHGCSLARVDAEVTSTQRFSCNNMRVAVDASVKGGYMLFEAEDGIHAADILVGTAHELGAERLVGPHGTSPRIGFDGKRFWATYLDVHGSLVIGTIENDGHIRAITLSNIRPTADAYDLAIGNNEVWVYAADGINGYTASRMCLARD